MEQKGISKGLPLSHCACDFLSFVCVTCNRKHTRLRAYHATEKQIPGLPLPYPESLPLPTYHPPYSPITSYFSYRDCGLFPKMSERSIVCPKVVGLRRNVFSPLGTICTRCRHKSIKALHNQKQIHPSLQILLELREK